MTPRARRGGGQWHVLVVDDHACVAEMLAAALQMRGYRASYLSGPDLPGDLPGLVTAAHRHVADLLVLDLDLGPLGDAAEAIVPLTAAGVPVVVLTASTEARRTECLALGARQVLAKTGPLEALVDAVDRVQREEAALGR